MQTALIFILFLCPLVFFHELGHFFFARLFGVRVEVFSLGFGPKLFKFKYGETEYAFSLIPLGGYVKMFGEDSLQKDEISNEDRAHSFSHKTKFARFCIVFGGPLANFVFTFSIFFVLLLTGERLPEIKFPIIAKQSELYQKGFRTGDVLRKVNGRYIYNPSDIAVQESDPIHTATMLRGDQELQIKVGLTSKDFLEKVFKNTPYMRSPILLDHLGAKYIISNERLEPQLGISLEEISSIETGEYFLFENTKEMKFVRKLNLLGGDHQLFFKQLSEMDLWALDLMIDKMNTGSAADKAGLKPLDIIIGINQKAIYSFEHLRKNLQKISNASSTSIEVIRSGKRMKFDIHPEVKKMGEKEVKLIGVYSSVELVPPKYVVTESKGLLTSATMAATRTWDTIVKTVGAFKKLITREASLKNIGGPIAIAKVASDSFNTSLSYFFQIMALISVNLGVINLFPIPVLDGGHIVFIILELFNRGPLSRRKIEVAQQFGLSFLLILTFAALYNDFSKLF